MFQQRRKVEDVHMSGISDMTIKNRSKRLEKVHVVIGHKSCDLDSLISAFTYAYFLEKVSPPGVLCLPVLNIQRTEFSYFTETRFILEELNLSESFHIFRDEINLHQLNAEGKLSLTLVGGNVLASEDTALESAVVKVINPVGPSDTGFESRDSSSSFVVKEILQEAPELITEQLAHLLRGSILFQCLTMEAEKISEKQEEILCILEEKFPNLPPREDIIRLLQGTQFSAEGFCIEQTILKDLKELSDGEIKVAVSTVDMSLEIETRLSMQVKEAEAGKGDTKHMKIAQEEKLRRDNDLPPELTESLPLEPMPE
ncbi:protein prune homolog 2-like [Echinops telfairi]|uniref:Protein prune homolog 2-like n=1 Tax=Echinops telfairi TaxID=9371 RepID=A0AC55CYA0_ECHTE|nr:protein prune homolog 2-like [Echinops telfairi]